MEFETQEAFLLDALAYYTVAPKQRRCATAVNGCYYSPYNAKKVDLSEGCIIGRHLTPEHQQIADKNNSSGSSGIISIMDRRAHLLPDWMKKFEGYFLRDCQILHDTDSYWNAKGLSNTGKVYLKTIIEVNKLDASQFETYLK